VQFVICSHLVFCHYPQHAFKDGTLEEVKLRHLGAADGSTVIVKNVRYETSISLECILVLDLGHVEC